VLHWLAMVLAQRQLGVGIDPSYLGNDGQFSSCCLPGRRVVSERVNELSTTVASTTVKAFALPAARPARGGMCNG
jgi:hypothetical protein